MKLIQKFRNYVRKVDTYVYAFPNGVRLVLSVNPATIDFDMSVVIRAGKYYENQLELPDGSAHFLEHILAGNPNKLFRTKKDLDEFEFGNKSRAGFNSNASTSRKFLYFYAHANQNAADRIVRYLGAKVDFPIDTIENYIEKERKIILGELHRDQKLERDVNYQYNHTIYGMAYPEYAKKVIGTEESIATISADDLRKYYHQAFTADKTIIAIQTSHKLSTKQKLMLTGISKLFAPANNGFKITKPDLGFKFKEGYFHDPDKRGNYLSLSFYRRSKAQIDYQQEVADYFCESLFYKLSHDYLREEKHLIYDPETFSESALFDYQNMGFGLTATDANLPTVLDEIYYQLTELWKNFLKSDEGKKWFAHQVSHYIYQRNLRHNSDFAEDIAVNILSGDEVGYDFRKAVKVARKFTVEMLETEFGKILSLPVVAWFNTGLASEKVEAIFHNSKLYKNYKLRLK